MVMWTTSGAFLGFDDAMQTQTPLRRSWALKIHWWGFSVSSETWCFKGSTCLEKPMFWINGYPCGIQTIANLVKNAMLWTWKGLFKGTSTCDIMPSTDHIKRTNTKYIAKIYASNTEPRFGLGAFYLRRFHKNGLPQTICLSYNRKHFGWSLGAK